MGLEASGASIHINRYESGKRTPAFSLVSGMAKLLRGPVSCFYEPDDTIAAIILAVGGMDVQQRLALLQRLQQEEKSQSGQEQAE
ncbi:XRE family transcriptional regulator [Candidatus Magnetaquicoccus inordinatus]|uniref:XRE family transcriptional regulator n=1 Tax=Candidatus Magnetaquicoccus inordinatus TaxID=2496818 RepID=UPI00187D1E28|nr:XRE family transcriptional regulator [Candidatus Magnetaquicoccus inordinatus]